MSYLGRSYLEEEVPEFDAGNATAPLAPALGDAAAGDTIQLFGGISMPRKTFYAVVILLVILGLVLLLKKRRQAAADAEAA